MTPVSRPSATRILPELQDLQSGDQILLTQDGKLRLPVVIVEPDRVRIFG